MKLKLVKKELIYQVENAPCPSVHASTLARMDDGRICAAWFGGTNEQNPDVCIWFSTQTNGIWAPPKKITPDNGIAHWNPTLYNDGGRLVLIYKEGRDPCVWHSMISESQDGGETWSAPEELVPGDVGGRGPVKNKLVKLANGKWLAPASLEDDKTGTWGCFADLSADGGKTWTASAPVPMTRPGDSKEYASHLDLPKKAGGLIQPAAWESKKGKVHMLMRSSFGFMYRTDSADGGKTWSTAYPCGLPNNNSGLDLVKTDSGLLALIYNPVPTNWGVRYPISLSLSDNNGVSWCNTIHLDTAEGEYSYPAIIADGGTLYMTYTWKRQSIVFAEVEIAE